MKKDYKELEGKEIIYDGCDGPEPAIIIGCNYDIGITIVNKNNHKDYFHCTAGPSSPAWKETNPNNKTTYHKTFYAKISMLKSGHYYVDRIKKIRGIVLGKPSKEYFFSSMNDCSFGL